MSLTFEENTISNYCVHKIDIPTNKGGNSYNPTIIWILNKGTMSDNSRALTIYWTCSSSIKSSNTITSSIVSPGDYLTSCICYSLPNNMIKKKVEVDLFIEMYWCVFGMLYNYVYYLLVYAVVTPGRRSKKKSVSWKR